MPYVRVTTAGGRALPGSRKLLQQTTPGDGAVAAVLERTGLSNAAQQVPGATVILPALGITPEPSAGTATAGDGTAALGSTAAHPNPQETQPTQIPGLLGTLQSRLASVL